MATPRTDLTGFNNARNRTVFCATMETTGRVLAQGTVATSAWIVGAFGTVVYAPAIVPQIGRGADLVDYLDGRLSYLSLIRGALSSPDLALYSRLIAEGTQKPFCTR